MTNNHWRKFQTEDFFIRDSKRKGYRSRSVYKLQEIDRKYRIFKNVESVIDIGSCPGGWSEFSRKKIKLDKSKTDLHSEHESFVTNMKWTINSKDSMSFENTVMLDGEPTTNKAYLKRVY